MKVVIIATEAVPFAKTGGPADVAGALPKVLAELGVETALIMPYYRQVMRGGFGEERVERIRVPLGKNSKTGSVYQTTIPGSRVPVYFISCDPLFNREGLYEDDGVDYPDNVERFTFFTRGAIQAINALNLKPDVLHINDWQTGLVPLYLRAEYEEDYAEIPAVLFTIHDVANQGNFDKKYYPITNLDWNYYSVDRIEYYGQFSFIKSGILYSDVITTVSGRYAHEIQTAEYGYGMDALLTKRRKALRGILNGIDYDIWNPANDEHLEKAYSTDDLDGKAVCKKALLAENDFPDDGQPLVGMISRLADEKGLDILVEGIDGILGRDCRYVLLGTGDQKYHRLFAEINKRHPKKFKVHLTFDEAMAYRIYAGSDIFLMPSRYEPCGLGQMISMAYGTVPVVRATGGLADTVMDADKSRRDGVGYSFERYSGRALVDALERAVSTYKNDPERWRKIMIRGMEKDFSWLNSAKKYIDVYEMAVKTAEDRYRAELTG
jgi:starch synthase